MGPDSGSGSMGSDNLQSESFIPNLYTAQIYKYVSPFLQANYGIFCFSLSLSNKEFCGGH
jgi:hypothetical protein